MRISYIISLLGGIVIGIGVHNLITSLFPQTIASSDLYKNLLKSMLPQAQEAFDSYLLFDKRTLVFDKSFRTTMQVLIFFYNFSLDDAYILAVYSMEEQILLPGVSPEVLATVFPQWKNFIFSDEFPIIMEELAKDCCFMEPFVDTSLLELQPGHSPAFLTEKDPSVFSLAKGHMLRKYLKITGVFRR